jgi:hypothetical protein
VVAFLFGLLMGAISGGVTYGLTDDSQAGLLFGGIAAVLTWVFGPTLLIGDD